MKAVLVTEMPNSCADCQIMADKWCYGIPADEAQDNININERPNWCPLRPLPSKRHIPITKTFGTPFNVGKAKGWNACIDEIMGEKDESNIGD